MAEQMDLPALITKLIDSNILCVGDLMLDRFVTGHVDRISPEAPIPVLSIKSETSVPGGAGNVARNLAALGAKCHLIAVVGHDSSANEIEGLMQSWDGVHSHLRRQNDRPTSVKIRYLAGGQQLLRADHEVITPLAKKDADEIIIAAKEGLKSADVLILSDYGKGVLTDDVITTLIAMATAANIPVIVDPKGHDYSKYEGASLLTPNRQELALASGMPVEGDEAIINACRHLIKSCGIKGILATRSEEGMTLVNRTDQGDAIAHLKARTREVFDVSGAGDTVVASLAAALGAGATLQAAAQLANTSAGVVVGKVGTAVVYPSEILAANHEDAWQLSEDKVVMRQAATDKVEAWHRKGHKVGFTNGCFDLLHPGHISLVNQARANCDKLILGLNSDESVKRLKGNDRPIQNETSRATVLASLANVDLVVIFGEDTPLELICDLKPDVLIKGADYTVSTVVGAEEVMSWGGKVVLANLVEGQSTTNTIDKMSN